jgi:hypothetical protein
MEQQLEKIIDRLNEIYTLTFTTKDEETLQTLDVELAEIEKKLNKLLNNGEPI